MSLNVLSLDSHDFSTFAIKTMTSALILGRLPSRILSGDSSCFAPDARSRASWSRKRTLFSQKIVATDMSFDSICFCLRRRQDSMSLADIMRACPRLTHLDVTQICQHAFLSARVQEVKMVLHELVHRLCVVHPFLEVSPIWLEHLCRDKGQDLLDKKEDPVAEPKNAHLPPLQFRVTPFKAPPRIVLMLDPDVAQAPLRGLEMDDGPLKELPAKNILLGYDERDRKADGDVELKEFHDCA